MCMHQRMLQNMKQKLKGEKDKSTIIDIDFTSLSASDGTSREKISKDIEELNTINLQDLTDMKRTFHPTRAEHTLFSSAHGTKINLILDHKTNLNKFKRIKTRASLVAQWLRICLLMQGTRVRALVWEDPTCRGAAGPVSHNC